MSILVYSAELSATPSFGSMWLARKYLCIGFIVSRWGQSLVTWETIISTRRKVLLGFRGKFEEKFLYLSGAIGSRAEFGWPSLDLLIPAGCMPHGKSALLVPKLELFPAAFFENVNRFFERCAVLLASNLILSSWAMIASCLALYGGREWDSADVSCAEIGWSHDLCPTGTFQHFKLTSHALMGEAYSASSLHQPLLAL